MSEGEQEPIPRGPKGGRRHQPGRGHDRKSIRQKKRRFAQKARRKREQSVLDARQQWAVWDALSPTQKLLLPELEPNLPRPDDETQSSKSS